MSKADQCALSADDHRAMARLIDSGRGDALQGELPDDDQYTLVQFGWPTPMEYGWTCVTERGRYVPVAPGLALFRPAVDRSQAEQYSAYLAEVVGRPTPA